MSKTYNPPKCPNLELPLIKVNNNDYMKVAHRLLWLVTEVKSYEIETSFAEKTATSATCRATITIYDDNKMAVRRVTAHKTEDTKGFGDFAEKAETGAIGRALASLGFGTAQAIADLDEGTRIVDAPLDTPVTAAPSQLGVTAQAVVSSFRKKRTVAGSESQNVVPMTHPGMVIKENIAATKPQQETTVTGTTGADGWGSEAEWK